MRSGKPVAVFAVLLVVSFATMNAMPSDTLLAALLQEAVLALVALAAVGFAVPDALKRCTQTVQQRSIVRFTAIILLLVGLVGGAITLLAWLFAGGGNMAGFASTALSSTADLMENLLLLLGICLLAGLYEESFMRVLGIEAFERTFGQGRAASGRAIGERDARPDASNTLLVDALPILPLPDTQLADALASPAKSGTVPLSRLSLSIPPQSVPSWFPLCCSRCCMWACPTCRPINWCLCNLP